MVAGPDGWTNGPRFLRIDWVFVPGIEAPMELGLSEMFENLRAKLPMPLMAQLVMNPAL